MSEPRIDAYLVTAGLARSRGQARELIDSGAVTLDGRRVTRASERVAAGATVEAQADRWVGRAAYKLLAALELFEAGDRVAGARCLDVGASTGGFTQVLLEHGAAHVVALDVGHGQLASAVANDPRVNERSGVNVRDLRPGDLGEPFDVLVADLSFISLRLVLPVLAEQLTPTGDAFVLIKPQFEVGRERLGKGGIVRSRQDRLDSVREVLLEAARTGLEAVRLTSSPLPGSGGNVEYLVWWRHGASRPGQGRADSTGDVALVEQLIDRLDEGLT